MVRKRNWGTSNTFSEAHRRCLPGNFCLWDIDGFLLDGSGEPCAIYEGKFKMASADRGNFIESFYHSNNLQASFLRKMSQVIPVWICEESTKNWWYLNNTILVKAENPEMDLYKTENRIYVEDILKGELYRHNPSGVFVRTEGEKPCQMTAIGERLSYILNVPTVLVNDIFEEGHVHFKNQDKDIQLKSEVLESFEGNWLNDWKDLEIV